MRLKTFAALLATLVISVGLGANALAQSGASGWFNFETNVQMPGDLIVLDDVTVTDQFSAADLTASDDTTVGDDLTVTDLALLDSVRLSAGTVISPGNAGIITPTASLQPISSGATVTPTLAAATAANGYAAGYVLVLRNTTNTTINLADSGNARLSAAWAGGQYDTLTLLSNGATWEELARSNN